MNLFGQPSEVQPVTLASLDELRAPAPQKPAQGPAARRPVDGPGAGPARPPAGIIPANERPDAEYPFVLITGRQLAHWHTGSMTRRASVLYAIEPMATASLCRADLQALNLAPGAVGTVQSRCSEVAIHVRCGQGTLQAERSIQSVCLLHGSGEYANPCLAGLGRQDFAIQDLRGGHQER